MLDNGLCLACHELTVSSFYQTAQSTYFTLVGRITRVAGGKGLNLIVHWFLFNITYLNVELVEHISLKTEKLLAISSF